MLRVLLALRSGHQFNGIFSKNKHIKDFIRKVPTFKKNSLNIFSREAENGTFVEGRLGIHKTFAVI